MRLRDSKLPNDDGRVHAGLVDIAENFDDPAHGPSGCSWPARQDNGHHLARSRPTCFACGDMHVFQNAPIEWDDKSQPGLIQVIAPDQRLITPFEDFDDATFRTIPR